MLDWLKSNGVKATFFVLGESLESDWAQSMARKIKKAGHDVESHSYNHADFTQLDAGSIQWQLEHTADLIERATGRRSRYFRPPYGFVSDYVHSQLSNTAYV